MCILISFWNLLIISVLITALPIESKQYGGERNAIAAASMNDLNRTETKQWKEKNVYAGYDSPDYYNSRSAGRRNHDSSDDSFERIERKINRRNKKRELNKHVSNQQPAAIFDLILKVLDSFQVNKKKIKSARR